MDACAALLAAVLDPAVALDIERFGRTRTGPDWRLDRRSVPEHYLWFVLRGRGRAAAAGRTIALAPGAAGWIAPGVVHDLVPDPTAGAFVFLHLRLAIRRTAPAPALLLPHAAHLRQVFTDTFAEWSGAAPWRELRLRAALAALLADFARSAHPAAVRDPTPARRDRILRHLDQHLPHRVHPAALLAAAGLSHDYGTRWFRRAYGMAPRTWLRDQRIRRAADDLAHSTEPLEAVARRWGFADHRLFDRQFRAVFGMAPGRWRQR